MACAVSLCINKIIFRTSPIRCVSIIETMPPGLNYVYATRWPADERPITHDPVVTSGERGTALSISGVPPNGLILVCRFRLVEGGNSPSNRRSLACKQHVCRSVVHISASYAKPADRRLYEEVRRQTLKLRNGNVRINARLQPCCRSIWTVLPHAEIDGTIAEVVTPQGEKAEQ